MCVLVRESVCACVCVRVCVCVLTGDVEHERDGRVHVGGDSAQRVRSGVGAARAVDAQLRPVRPLSAHTHSHVVSHVASWDSGARGFTRETRENYVARKKLRVADRALLSWVQCRQKRIFGLTNFSLCQDA